MKCPKQLLFAASSAQWAMNCRVQISPVSPLPTMLTLPVFGAIRDRVEARAYWGQNGMKIVGAGHLALGGGSGMDGAAKVSAEKVLLVDVSGIDFEGFSNARFGFYDNTLYRIQATLTPILSERFRRQELYGRGDEGFGHCAQEEVWHTEPGAAHPDGG